MKNVPSTLDDVTHVVDRRTGSVYSPGEYKTRQLERNNARRHERFIKGPIAVHWIAQAFKLTPSASKCAVALFYQRGLLRRDRFKIEPARFLELGIGETARRRGLHELERAGLVECEKQASKTPIVKLIGLSRVEAP